MVFCNGLELVMLLTLGNNGCSLSLLHGPHLLGCHGHRLVDEILFWLMHSPEEFH